jgi:hypothetical protein
MDLIYLDYNFFQRRFDDDGGGNEYNLLFKIYKSLHPSC